MLAERLLEPEPSDADYRSEAEDERQYGPEDHRREQCVVGKDLHSPLLPVVKCTSTKPC